MESYQIKDEGELFSSCFISLKNRVSDRDQDDMSFYNTATIIEQRLSTIFGRFRRAFFEKFGNFNDLTRIDMHRTSKEHKEVFRRVCNSPTEEMKQLACAYYKVAYHKGWFFFTLIVGKHFSDTLSSKRFLSFAWLTWDIINAFRHENLVAKVGLAVLPSDPLSERISKHIEEVVTAYKNSLQRFQAKFVEESPKLKQYCDKHIGKFLSMLEIRLGLLELLFFCYKWACNHRLFSGAFKAEHLCSIVILFGLNKLQTHDFGTNTAWLQEVRLLLWF